MSSSDSGVPSSSSPRRLARVKRALKTPKKIARSRADEIQPPTKYAKVLYLGANPPGTSRLGLYDEVRAIKQELRSARHRCFDLVSCWATEANDLIRELRESLPTICHFGGHGCKTETFADLAEASRDAVFDRESDTESAGGLVLHARDGSVHVVPYELVRKIFELAGSSVKLVVLTACATEPLARLLLNHVDCAIGMDGPINDDIALEFSKGFYAGIGDGASIEQAFQEGCVAIECAGLRGADRPKLKVRNGVNASEVVLAGVLDEDERGPRRQGRFTRTGKRRVQKRTLRPRRKLEPQHRGASAPRGKSHRGARTAR